MIQLNSTSFGFSPDFSSQTKGFVYQDVHLPIADQSVIDALRRHATISSKTTIEEILLSAFCTTVYRTNGITDGKILLIGSANSTGSLRILDINLEPTHTVVEAIQATGNLLRSGDLSHEKVDSTTVSMASNLRTLFQFVDDTSTEDVSASLCTSNWIFSYHPDDRSLRLSVKFNPNVYSKQSVEMFGRLIERTVKMFSSFPDSPLITLPMASSEDISAIKKWNDVPKEPLPFQSINEAITSVASRLPNNAAVIHEDGSFTLTYSQLDKMSDALARWLLSKNYGGAEETAIGVWQTRTAFLVITYLACLKAGCAYLPLDMTLPAARLKQMLEISSCPLVLGYSSPFTFPWNEIVDFVDLASPDMQRILCDGNWNETTPLPDISGDRLAYIIFTSGSTGAPKAIAIQHREFVNFLNFKLFDIHEGDRVALLVGVAFDVSSGEIWYSLSRGATLVSYLQSATETYDVLKMGSLLVRERIVAMIPSFGVLKTLVEANFFLQPLPYLRCVAMGGEPATPDVIRAIQSSQPHIQLTNCYGPSEATVYCVFYDVPTNYQRTITPIGTPRHNTGAYLVDDNLNLVPQGVCGEVVLTGECLARGYHSRPDLTKEKFIVFPESHPLYPMRAYLTGDIARMNAYGELEFLFRRDDGQVKIQGQRLELGEVEAVMKTYSGVRSAVVALERLDETNSRLIGYFTGTADSNDVTAYLRENLPAFMVPVALIHIPEIPLGLTGKIDRKLLSDSNFIQKFLHSSDTREGNRRLDNLRAKMRELFSSALGVAESTVSVSANLFELGGHSLTAMRILIKIQKEFGVKLDFQTFMKSPTVLGLTDLVAASRQASRLSNEIKRIDSDVDSLPASDAQTRLWVEEQMHPGLTRYNTALQRRFAGPLQIDALRQALMYLVHRHEPLRTTCSFVDGVVMQNINPPGLVTIRTISLEGVEDAETRAQEALLAEAEKPFYLATELPSRFLIVKVSDQVHYLSIILHHICTDGWSMGIVENEITLAYNSYINGQDPQLRPLSLRYRDYSIWDKTRQKTAEVDKQLQYWVKQLKGSAPLELPTDFIRPDELSCHWDELVFDVPVSCIENVNRLASKHTTSLFSVLLAAFRAALYRMTGAEDGNLAIVNANRTQPGLEDIVGFFVNIQAIRLTIEEQTCFNDLILQTNSALRDALDNSDAPFEKIVGQLAPKREVSRNPLAQILCVLQDFSASLDGGEMPQMHDIISDEIRWSSVRLDLSFHLYRNKNSIRGYAMYQADLFTRQTIQTLINVYLRILDEASSNAACPLGVLPLVTQRDLQQFEEWNETSQPHNQELPVHERFRQVALSCGPDLAVVDDSVSLTYSELDQRSDCLASWLIERGIPAQGVVGIWINRSALLVTAYLSCLKAGLAYMPLDKSIPNGRLSQMISASECKLILANGSFPLEDQVPSIDLSVAQNLLFSSAADISFPKVPSRSLSNVIFTSGSTGVPKGVMVEHLGMFNLCTPETSAWPDHKSRNALTAGIGFDPSGFQIFATLLSGSELHILRDDGTFDIDEFQNFLIKSRIQKWSTTPSVLAALLKTDSKWLEETQLNHIMLGGERLEPVQIAECYSRLPNLSVSSSYGPAEATVRSAYHLLPSANYHNHSRIPLGRALPNTKVHVVDKNMQLVPPGVIGEIAVSGIHVARGYISQPALTEARFLSFPKGHPMHPKVYLTGDLGYWTEDGLLQYAGRADTQLKLRGQRLEAGELESLINRHPSVQASAVVVPKIGAAQQLIAYIQLVNEIFEEDVLQLWDSHYNVEETFDDLALEDVKAGHDFNRWLSMFTGKRIPLDQMEEWLEDTLQQIAPTSQDTVLEIGVGTGMIALGIIDKVAGYVGIDISAPSLAFLKKQIEARDLVSKFSLKRAAAHELEGMQNSNISLVVINSVLQYFPSAEYLTEVLEKLIGLLEDGGRIFLGDLRSLSLITLHDFERALGSLQQGDTASDVRTTVSAYGEYQAELLVDPTFFFALQQKHSSISHVEIKPKGMKVRNELSRYRYAAVLHVNSKKRSLDIPQWIDYSKENMSPNALRSMLRSNPESETRFGVSNIPHPDLSEVHNLLTVVKNPASLSSVHSLRNFLESGSSRNFSMPATLHELAAQEGWSVSVDYANQTVDSGYLRAIFYRPESLSSDEFPSFPPISPSAEQRSINKSKKPVSDYHQVFEAIKNYLQQHFPDSMLPSQMIKVSNLPLNRSGKLDRPLLSSAEFFQEVTKDVAPRVRRAPSNAHEEAVLAIFSRALHLPAEQIDVEDSLFDLGGHSLVATTIVTAVRRELNTNLSMASFFRHPTIQAVAAIVSSQTKHINGNGDAHLSDDAIDLLKQAINFNTDHTGPVLFMFPETTGFAGVYTATFGTIDAKIVAFGDEGWGGTGKNRDETVESLSNDYVKEILSIQPTGPFYLAGWSFGGTLAYEIACQLEEQGHDIQLLIIFDSGVYNGPAEAPQWRSAYDHLLTIIPSKDLWMTQFARVSELISKYEVSRRKYSGHVVFVKALRGRQDEDRQEGDSLGGPPKDPENGWKPFLPQLIVQGFDSTHRRMFDGENGKKMGRLISQLIRDA